MLNRIIADRLKEHRRLVIPKLGAFIIKEADGKILFSELLRGDDGVLRGLVKASGVGDIEAAGVIDRFVFEVRNTLDGGRPYAIGELGALQRGANGAITFVQKTPARAVAEPDGPEVSAVSSGRALRAVYEEDTKNDARSDAGAAGGRNSRPAAVGRPKRRRGADLFLLVAVIIAALAVAVMVYGYYRANEQEEVSVRDMFFPAFRSSSETVDLSVPSGVADSAEDVPSE